MQLVDIQVESYAGYRADETPRRFCWEGNWIEVTDVLDRWHQGNRDPEWPMADYFKILAADQREYLIKHDLEADTWYFLKRW